MSGRDDFDYDESQETYEDPYGDADKDETMPGLYEETVSAKPIPKVLGVSEVPLSQQRNVRLYKEGEKTARQLQNEKVFQSDRLRQKYDLRYTDSDRVNNLFLRGHINKLKRETDERKQEKK
jgi:hypothetical protein